MTENLTIKFTKVETNELSNSEVYLVGDGLAVLPNENTQLPLKFKAEVNPVEEVVSDVEYSSSKAITRRRTTKKF